MFGYAGTLLNVNLTTGKIRTEKLTQEVAKKYVGGIGLGMYLWLSNSKAGVDPFNPENPLILSLGPLAGTMFPTGGNGHAFISKSPATGGVGEAVSHGTFGTELKRAGYDAVIIVGKSEKPVYLWIDDNNVQLRDASDLWGKSPAQTEDELKDKIGDHYIRVSSIGLAGEKLSKIACIVNDKTRVAGRTGLGAVMGSKNLKAIAVRGTCDVAVAKPVEFMDMVEEFHERMKGPAAQKYRTLGSIENLAINNEHCCMPTQNYNAAHFDAQKINPEVLNEHFVTKIIACNSCAMRCEHEVVLKEGFYTGTMARLEYDNLWALGPNCGVSEPNFIIKAAERCNHYGLDAQSTGVSISFVMECYEKGILTSEQLGGVDAHFGTGNAMVNLIEKIGKREGIGDLLADGVKVAAEKIGKNSLLLAMHIKGLEVTGYDLRSLKTAALGSAVSFRGADHSRSSAYTLDLSNTVDRLKAEEGRGKLVKDLEDSYDLLDSFIICKNAKGTLYGDLVDLTKIYSAVTGFEVTAEELAIMGERIHTLAKLINTREGLSRKDDTLPWKVMNQPVQDEGPAQGAIVTQEELNLMLDDYYTARGWTKKGFPTEAKLKELDLEKFSNLIKDVEG
ncbi:MAG: aldehyde ferredoxin oxidoreductase family protein [Candidatus Bathyarchaeota archaeon]|nr:aldehyde ferredoxin oxidoreductase family protein [Candidatus Bathyarchaeota archaeon]